MTRGLPTLGTLLHHDWARHYFRHLPERPDWEEHLDAPYLYPGTLLQGLHESREGMEGAVLVARNPKAGVGRRRHLMWHGRHRLMDEAFHGWFGHRLQPVRTESFRLLLDRLDHFLILDATTKPTYLIPLGDFARLGVSHGVLESVLDAQVRVAGQGLWSKAAFATSLRVYVPYDGARYQESTRKTFYDPNGNPVTVEWVAREVLHRLGYEAVSPAVFNRLFVALVGRPAMNYSTDFWPRAFLNGRLSPLEWVHRARTAINDAKQRGMHAALVEALEKTGNRPPFNRHPPPDGALPLIARYLTRTKFEEFAASVGNETLAAIFEGFVEGYRVNAADWFAYQPGGRRNYFCEVKSRGDHLRETQKESIQWCRRNGGVDYRLLELLHNLPA